MKNNLLDTKISEDCEEAYTICEKKNTSRSANANELCNKCDK